MKYKCGVEVPKKDYRDYGLSFFVYLSSFLAVAFLAGIVPIVGFTDILADNFKSSAEIVSSNIDLNDLDHEQYLTYLKSMFSLLGIYSVLIFGWFIGVLFLANKTGDFVLKQLNLKQMKLYNSCKCCGKYVHEHEKKND